MPKYNLYTSNLFDRRLRKLVKKDKNLRKSIFKTLDRLTEDPYQTSLKTHKVDSKVLKSVYSSRVTGDFRIIWGFSKTRIQMIELYDIGGHEGSNKVYN